MTKKITTKHMDALTHHLADALGGPKLTAAAVLRESPAYTDLATVDAALVRESLADAGATAHPMERATAARLFALLAPGDPTCNRCGRLALRLNGSTWERVTAATCPVDAGLYEAEAVPVVRGWHDGREYAEGTTHDGAGVPLTEAVVRAERAVAAEVDAALRETGATLLDVLAATVRGGATPAEALTALGSPLARWPSVAALRAFVAQAKGAAARAAGGPTPPPFSGGGDAGPVDLRALRGALASLYQGAATIRRAASDAGVNTSRVDFAGSDVATWHAVIEEAAKTGHVGALLGVALREYPRHAALLALTAQPAGDRDAVYATLVRLLPAQFEAVVFRLGVASHVLPGATAPLAERAVALVRIAEQQGRLAELAAAARAR